MNKQEFIFVFPQSGETITKKMNPLAVKDAAVKYLKMQNEVRGDICIIKNAHEDVVAMAYVSDMMKVSFFTEDESVNDIKTDRSNRGRRGEMSEINFKAKLIDTEMWLDCKPYANSQFFSRGNINPTIDTNTLCQFTGARDCNGFPIYEHDLLRQYEDTGSIYEVVWNQGNTSFSLVDTEYPVLYPNTLGRMLRNRQLKVIGNKFDKKGGKQ